MPNITTSEPNRFEVRQQMVTPGPWELTYTLTPVSSITGQVLDDEQVYRRWRHTNNEQLGYEYATILDIIALES